MPNPAVRAVLWDFGGVMTESPFVAFRRFEQARRLPANFLRDINTRNPDGNAWARFERSEPTPGEFDRAYATETRAAGHEVRGLDVIDLFDTVIESSKVGARKPEARFFELVCTQLQIAPEQAVYLDDLGANLKPARAMGMRTIKVGDPATALAELETALAIVLR